MLLYRGVLSSVASLSNASVKSGKDHLGASSIAVVAGVDDVYSM